MASEKETKQHAFVKGDGRGWSLTIACADRSTCNSASAWACSWAGTVIVTSWVWFQICHVNISRAVDQERMPRQLGFTGQARVKVIL